MLSLLKSASTTQETSHQETDEDEAGSQVVDRPIDGDAGWDRDWTGGTAISRLSGKERCCNEANSNESQERWEQFLWSKRLAQSEGKCKDECAGNKEIDRLDPARVTYCQLADLASQRMKSRTDNILKSSDKHEERASQNPSGEQ